MIQGFKLRYGLNRVAIWFKQSSMFDDVAWFKTADATTTAFHLCFFNTAKVILYEYMLDRLYIIKKTKTVQVMADGFLNDYKGLKVVSFKQL